MTKAPPDRTHSDSTVPGIERTLCQHVFIYISIYMGHLRQHRSQHVRHICSATQYFIEVYGRLRRPFCPARLLGRPARLSARPLSQCTKSHFHCKYIYFTWKRAKNWYSNTIACRPATQHVKTSTPFSERHILQWRGARLSGFCKCLHDVSKVLSKPVWFSRFRFHQLS